MIESHPEGQQSSTNYQLSFIIYHLSFIIYHLSFIIYHLSFIIYQPSTMNKKELWKKILDIAITILTAIATSLTTTSCMGVI